MKIDKLTEDNWITWSKVFAAHLRLQGIYEQTLGHHPDINYDYILHSYLCCHLGPRALMLINDAQTGKEAWDLLRNEYEFGAQTRVRMLISELYQMNMKESEDLMEHVYKVHG